MEPGSSESGAVGIADPVLRRVFGFELDGDAWIGRIRDYVSEPTLGRLGPYELLAVAGRGGQGLVYKVRQPRTGREVALKRLAAGRFSTPDMHARFQREVESVAALEHPNIVTLFGSEEVEGQPVLVMQWIDGVPYDQWARPSESPHRPYDEVLVAFVKVCKAVAHAHQRGIIHRDLKPSNILVDGANEPHVLDFGLARFDDDSSAEVSLTRSGAILGTPAYSPPEQLRGDARNIDVRADVYSLGAVLFKALTGSTPFEPQLGVSDILRSMESRCPRRPHSINPMIDRELSLIVTKCLDIDAEHRYASVDALRNDVERFLAGKPIEAHPHGKAYLARKLVKRHRVAFTLGFVILTLIVATAITSTVLYFRAEHHRERADKEARNAEREAYVSRKVKEFLQQMFVSSAKGTGVQGASLSMREALDRAAAQIDSATEPLDPAVEAAVRMIIATSYRELGLDAGSEPHYQAALKLRMDIYGPRSIEVAECQDALARAYRVLGRLADAEGMIESAWTTYASILPENDGYFAMTANSVALVKKSLGKFEESEKWYREALRRYTLAWGPDGANIPYVLINMGSLYVTMGRLQDAEVQFRDALSRCEKLHGEKPHIDTFVSMSSLADVLAQQGDAENKALEMFETSKAGLIKLFGPSHFRVGVLCQRYANALASKHRFDDAISQLQEAIGAFRELQRWNDVLSTSVSIAFCLHKAERTAEAIEHLSNELVTLSPKVEPNNPSLGSAHLELAEMMTGNQELTSARTDHLRSAESIFAAAGPAAEAKLARVRTLLGR